MHLNVTATSRKLTSPIVLNLFKLLVEAAVPLVVGGGAGGFYSTDPNVPAPTRASAITASVQTYPVVIGAGGKGGGFSSF